MMIEMLTKVISHLPLPDRLLSSTASPAFSEAARWTVRGVAIDLRQRSRDIPARLLAAPSVVTVALTSPAACTASGSPAAAAAQAHTWDPEEHRLWQQGGRRLRPAAAAWHLRRAAAALSGGKRAGPPASRPRSLTLLVAAPEMDATAAELHRMLATAGAEGLFAAVSVPQGLVRLDGSLAAQLTACNTRAATLPAALQVSSAWPHPPPHLPDYLSSTAPRLHARPGRAWAAHTSPRAVMPPHAPRFLFCAAAQAPTCYSRLERLALKLAPDDDLPTALGCVSAGTLPALRCLALLAPVSAGVAADLRPLRHGGLTRLDLQGVQLPAGFASLQQLTGEGCGGRRTAARLLPRGWQVAKQLLCLWGSVPAALPPTHRLCQPSSLPM